LCAARPLSGAPSLTLATLRFSASPLAAARLVAAAASENLKIGNVTFTTHDLGGHVGARKLWKNYFPDVSGILYMVDAADPARFAEAKKQLDLLLQEEELAHVPFAIIGNKIDLRPNQLRMGHPGAVPETELRMHLGLSHTTESEEPQPGVRGMGLFMSSVNMEIGYEDAFKWIANYM
jgi:GTP-binding protein SAR1